MLALQFSVGLTHSITVMPDKLVTINKFATTLVIRPAFQGAKL
jgi:hypothetical protein